MDYNSISEFYDFIEHNIRNVQRQFDLTRDLKQLAEKALDPEIKSKLQWEMLVFDFTLENGHSTPVYSTTKEDSTVWQYPSYQDFSERGYQYLVERAGMVNNDLLIIRYNQILWNSPSKYKHQKQANAAIDAYIRILESYKPNKEIKGYNWNYFATFKNLLHLCSRAKYRFEKAKEIVRLFLFKNIGFPNEYKILLIDFLLELPQFKKTDFSDILPLIKKMGAVKQGKKLDFFDQRQIYEIGLKVAQKLSSNLSFWYNKIGDNVSKAAESRLNDETRGVPLGLYKEAISFYKKAGNTKKVKGVEEKYFHLKKELKLHRISAPLEDKYADFINTYIDNLCNGLLRKTPNEIFDYLATGKDIFPDNKLLKESAEERKASFIDRAMIYQFDINNNIVNDTKIKKDKTQEMIYKNYNHYLHFVILPCLHKLFINGIKKGTISYLTLVKYFMENTWFGQEITESNTDRETRRYKWIGLIAPSLLEYFMQTDSALKSNNPYTNYILCIDSLTLKFEAALRTFAGCVKIPTTVSGKRDVLREKYIEELLADEKMQKYFDENDRLFFIFLFASKDGLNLRNNIAHSFFRFENYSIQYMHLLICAFLRLGKYKLKGTGG